ncbi:MAG: hypothetical protein U0R17_02945 [Acidimicrobiia bacterium]
MNFKNCPYDFTEIEINGYEGGVYVVSCPVCGGVWEAQRSWVARVSDPDWEIVKAFKEIASLATTKD